MTQEASVPLLLQGRMWESNFKEMNMPQSSFEKFKFADGYPKVNGYGGPCAHSALCPCGG